MNEKVFVKQTLIYPKSYNELDQKLIVMRKIVVIGISFLFATINCFAQGPGPRSNRYKPQGKHDSTSVFVRVYNMQGKKIARGKILLISESSLQLYGVEKPTILPATDIGMIKTKHSGGYNVLLGATIGAVVGMIYVVGESSGGMIGVDHAGLVGAVLGIAPGTLVGGLTTPFKKPKSYNIDGDTLKLRAFKEEIIGMPK